MFMQPVFWFFVLFISGFLASPWFSWTERRYTWQKRPRFNAEKRKLEGLSKQRLAVCMIKWFLYQSVGMSTRPLVSFKTMTLWLQRRVSPKPCLMWKYINFGIVLPWSMLTLPFTFTDFLPLVFLRASMLPFFYLPPLFNSGPTPVLSFPIFWTSLYFCTLHFPFPLVKLWKRGHVPCLLYGPRPRPTRYQHIV